MQERMNRHLLKTLRETLAKTVEKGNQIPDISFDFENPPPQINIILPKLLGKGIVKSKLENGIMKIWLKK